MEGDTVMDAPAVKPPLFSNRALINLTIPVIIDALLAILAGTADAAMVSSAGEAAVSAVSLVDAINILFIGVFSSIAVGGSVVTAQYIGSRNYENAKVSANQLLYAATFIATVLMTALLSFHGPLLRLIYGGIDAEVYANAKVYFFITLLGYPFLAMGSSSGSVLRSMGKNRQAVTVTIISNAANVVGNALLIYVFRLGIAGAAISTTFSRFIYAALGLFLAHNKKLPAHFQNILRFRLNLDVMRRVLRIGLTNGIEGGLFYVGKLLIASLVSGFGTVVIAADTAAQTITNLGWTIVGSFGTVMLTVVGQCIGAGEPEQAKAYSKKLLTAATVAMVAVFGSIFLLRHQVVRLFDFGPESLELAGCYTGICALCSIFSLYSFSFVPMSAFRAAGDIRYAVTLSICSMFAFRVALCFLLNAIFPTIGILCVYVSMSVDWIFRSVMNIFRYRSGKWLHKKLI